jgi:type II secretory pathway component PulF
MALELQTATQPARSARPRTLDLKLPSLARKRLKDRDRMFFTEQLALLLETGTSLYNALGALRQQSSNPAMAEVLEALMTDIAGGRPFSQALAKHPTVFSPNYVNLIAASETGGFMHKVLAELLAMEEKREELKSTLFSALSYPAFLICFSIAVVIFVLVVVFPKFGTLFVSIQDQLPITTKILMVMSNGLLDYWLYGFIAIGGVLVGLNRWLATAQGRESLDRMVLTLPVMRSVFAELYMVQVLRVMSLSLGNGVPMVETLQACRDVVNNSVFRRFIDNVEALVQEGRGLAAGFERAPFVPPVAKAMLSTAEESGNVAKVAARVADYYERELTQRLKTLSKMAEPVMLLVMGAVVGLLVSSLILPIFKLSRAVS